MTLTMTMTFLFLNVGTALRRTSHRHCCHEDLKFRCFHESSVSQPTPDQHWGEAEERT